MISAATAKTTINQQQTWEEGHVRMPVFNVWDKSDSCKLEGEEEKEINLEEIECEDADGQEEGINASLAMVQN